MLRTSAQWCARPATRESCESPTQTKMQSSMERILSRCFRSPLKRQVSHAWQRWSRSSVKWVKSRFSHRRVLASRRPQLGALAEAVAEEGQFGLVGSGARGRRQSSSRRLCLCWRNWLRAAAKRRPDVLLDKPSMSSRSGDQSTARVPEHVLCSSACGLDCGGAWDHHSCDRDMPIVYW